MGELAAPESSDRFFHRFYCLLFYGANLRNYSENSPDSRRGKCLSMRLLQFKQLSTRLLFDQSKEVVAKCDHLDEVVANCDHLQTLKFRPTLPFAFTEQGIGQLSTVVHSKIAIERSIMIMNA